MTTANKVVNRRAFKPGEIIFKQGDRGDYAYMIERGAVRIVRQTPTGPVELAVLRPGSIFGEMAMIDDQPRMAMAEAAEDTSVIYVNHDMFTEKLDVADPFVCALLRILVQNVRSVGTHLRSSSSEGAGRH